MAHALPLLHLGATISGSPCAIKWMKILSQQIESGPAGINPFIIRTTPGIRLRERIDTPMSDHLDTPRDGRKARAQASRRKIIAAMVDLVREGIVAPTAEMVATRAGVGLRTVFRHFDDMESLYREISTEVMQLVTPLLAQPLQSQHWRERLQEVIERRAHLFEAILPFRIATETLRHTSATLQRNQALLIGLQDSLLRRVLPAEIQQDAALFAALSLALSASAWQQLRQEQQLPPDAARQAVTLTVHALTARVAD